MAKGKSGSGDRVSKVAKAGKRSGNFTMPPAINPDKRAAREAGEQQFIAKQQLFIEREVKIYNNSWVPKVKRIQVPVDFIYDKNRKRPVMSPKFTEKND